MKKQRPFDEPPTIWCSVRSIAFSLQANFESDIGTMTRLINQITGIEKNVAAMHQAIEQMRAENQSAEERMDAPFEKAGELERLRTRAEEIADILNPVEDQAGTEALEDEGEETEEPKVKYSMRGKDGKELEITAEEMEENKKEVAEMIPIEGDFTEADMERFVNTGDFFKEGEKYFSEIGGYATNDTLGKIILSSSGLRHIVGRKNVSIAKAKTLVAVKPILENGRIIAIDNEHKGKAVDTAIIGGKIRLSDGVYYVGVLVSQHNGGTRGQENHYAFHDAIAIKEGATESSVSNDASVAFKGGSSIKSLLHEILAVNRQEKAFSADTN